MHQTGSGMKYVTKYSSSLLFISDCVNSKGVFFKYSFEMDIVQSQRATALN
jgi:hypothetical protein